MCEISSDARDPALCQRDPALCDRNLEHRQVTLCTCTYIYERGRDIEPHRSVCCLALVIMAYIPRASVFQKSKLMVREDEALRDLDRITRAKDLIAQEEAQVARTLAGYRCSSTKPLLGIASLSFFWDTLLWRHALKRERSFIIASFCRVFGRLHASMESGSQPCPAGSKIPAVAFDRGSGGGVLSMSYRRS
jgi:hypothetical protein